MSVLQVDDLWSFIQTLSLSNRNKQWLAAKFMKSTKQMKDKEQDETEYSLSSDAIRQIIVDGDQQIAAGVGVFVKVDDLWK